MASPHHRSTPLPPVADVTLVIGSDTIAANREALSAQSDFFRGMFSANFAEREKKEVELFDVPATIEVVKRVVKFAELFPRSQLDIDDVDGLCGALAVADMMGIRCAVKACCDKLLSILERTPDRALEVYCKTEFFCADSEVRAVCNLAGKTALFCVKDWTAQDVGSAKLHHMETLLSRSDLNLSSELEVFRLIKSWVTSQSTTTGLTRLLHCIRFQQVSNNDLRKMLNDQLVLEASRAARDMLQELLDYREMKATKARMGSPPALVGASVASDGGPFRKLPKFPCVMSLVRDKMTVLKYDPQQNSLTEVTQFLCNYDSGDAKGVRACTDGVSIYLTGGELAYGRGQWLRKAWVYNSLTEHWSVLQNVEGAEIEIESPRRHHSTCIHGQKIFMVGGFGTNRIPLNTVDLLDMSSGTVAAVSNLPQAMFGVGACVFKGAIYVIKDTILVYKNEENSWDRLARLTVRDVAQAVADEEYIYITTKSTYDLYRFSPDELVAEQDVEPELLGRFSSEAQNLCLVDGVIYNFSTEQFDDISTVETYSVREGNFSQPWTKKGKVYDFNPNKSVGAFPLVIYPDMKSSLRNL